MDRLISEKKAIEAINDYWGEMETPTIDGYINAIKTVPSADKWIPVSKRLPTEEDYIANNGLFIVSDGNRTYTEYFDVYCSMRFGEPTMSGFRVDRCVAAWMPLPTSYEQQESEDKK